MTNDSSSFDPLSSANTTATVLAIIALFCLSIAAFTLGRAKKDRSSSSYQLSWWGIPSAACLFIVSLLIYFAYD